MKMEPKVNEIILLNISLNCRKNNINKELLDIAEELERNNKFLWDNCVHEWQDQRDSSMYEKSTYKCIKCGLINDSRFYN